MSVHKLRGLEYLVAVVDHGGFNAAARHLGVAPPSLHRLVRALEAELGVTLIDRSAHPLRATAGAAFYIERARSLLQEMAELDASLRDQAQAPRGSIRLAAQSVVLQFIVPDLLPRFHARYPEISLDIVEAGPERDLARLGTDLLLQFGWPPPQDALLRTLVDTRWLVVATPGYWVRHGVPEHPSALSGHRCALFRTPFGEVIHDWAFARDGDQVTVVVDGWLTSENRQVLDAPLYGGQIVARINDLTAHPGIADGRLQPVLLDWTGLNAPPLSLVLKRSLAQQPRIRAWVGYLVEQARQLAAVRLPAGLPPVRPAERPAWWRRRVRGFGPTHPR